MSLLPQLAREKINVQCGRTGEATDSSALGDDSYFQTRRAMKKRLNERKGQKQVTQKQNGKQSSKCGDEERREGTANYKTGRKVVETGDSA